MTGYDLPRRLAAEAGGTAVLVATVVGSGIMAERLAVDPALALLCNTLPTAAILVVLVTALAPISGAHLNPAVSVMLALRKDLGWRQAAAYACAQAVGGVLGTLLAHAMFGAPLIEVSSRVRAGAGPWLSEAVATFGLVATILLALRHRPGALPALVGLYIGSAYWFTASTSFANPAVTMARALTGTFSGISPADVPGFVAAQLAGALLAWAGIGWLLREDSRRNRAGLRV